VCVGVGVSGAFAQCVVSYDGVCARDMVSLEPWGFCWTLLRGWAIRAGAATWATHCVWRALACCVCLCMACHYRCRKWSLSECVMVSNCAMHVADVCRVVHSVDKRTCSNSCAAAAVPSSLQHPEAWLIQWRLECDQHRLISICVCG
jgi:hypothetical protein